MNPRICICCGEPMAAGSKQNPNICIPCLTMEVPPEIDQPRVENVSEVRAAPEQVLYLFPPPKPIAA